ncbi:MAG: hypothetical protein NTZ97_00010 [Candidatus Moranbacteria bacterium]|nr:hypothetical protein [Candidatus Moranbacteria bacterium]
MKQSLWTISKVILLCGFLYLGILASGFFGVKYGYTNVAGAVDANNQDFVEAQKKVAVIEKIEQAPALVITTAEEKQTDAEKERENSLAKVKDENLCKILTVENVSPINAKAIADTYEKTGSHVLVAKMILAVKLRLKDNEQFNTAYARCEKTESQLSLDIIKLRFASANNQNIFPWMNSGEWETIKQGVIKDKDSIIRAANAAGVEPRLLVASLIVEQIRLFYSQRELFEKFFEPLKILGNATKISLGVMGIKEKTAIDVENHLKDKNSPYYLGAAYENLLDFKTQNISGERYTRLTNDKDHYYCYLYGALYLKQIISQWQKAGYNIQYRAEIVGTLFNVGFPQSKPNPNPKVGGSAINVGSGKYSFGSLSYEFYYSGELQEEFPFQLN